MWSTLLASLGAAGRTLLTSGADFSDVLEQVSASAGGLTQTVLTAAAVVGAGTAAVVTSQRLLPDPSDLGRDLRPKAPGGAAAAKKAALPRRTVKERR